MNLIETATLKCRSDVTDCSGAFGFEHAEPVGLEAPRFDSAEVCVDEREDQEGGWEER